ncbi:MAG: MarR family transcriptional regulator [Methanosphaera stadtmanae]|nr:MarR family transcriptional regulator [Methanosphaera stadtmanae]
MPDLNFSKEQISYTPVILFTDYINLQFNNYLNNNYKNVSPRDFTYLVNIFYHQNISQRQLAELLYVSEANVAQIIKRLEKNELITRIPDENNKSRKILFLTQKGKNIVFMLLKEIYEWESKFFDKYTDEEINIFKKILYDYSQSSIQ